MKTLAIAMLLLVSTVLPAEAFFTSSEYTSLQGLLTAQGYLMDAVANGYFGEGVGSSAAGNRTYTRDAWSKMATGNKSLSRGMCLLLHVDPDTADGTPASSRAAIVARAVTEIASARTDIAAAYTALDDGINAGSGVVGLGWLNAMSQTRNFVALSRNEIDNSWNAALTYTSYATPWGDRAMGPHGFRQTAIFKFCQALTLLSDGTDKMRETWDWVANSESAWSAEMLSSFGRFHLRIGNITRNYFVSMAAIGWVVPAVEMDTPTRVLTRNFGRIYGPHSESQDRLHQLAGAAYHWDNMDLDPELIWATQLEGLVSRTTSRALWLVAWRKANLDAWARGDGAGWKIFEFPDADTLATLRANPPQANDINGPPISWWVGQ